MVESLDRLIARWALKIISAPQTNWVVEGMTSLSARLDTSPTQDLPMLKVGVWHGALVLRSSYNEAKDSVGLQKSLPYIDN